MNQRKYLSKINARFVFKQNTKDFIVDEIIDKRFTNSGNYLILHVKKQQLDTWEMIRIIANFLGIGAFEIGYGGLKDKHATTTQYISIEKKHHKNIKKFKHPKITILQTYIHKFPMRVGELIANRFSINLYDVDIENAKKIQHGIQLLRQNGFENYFGYQRFGKKQDSIKQAKEFVNGDIFIKDAKLKRFLTSIYQSNLFNQWLCKRVEISKGLKTLKKLDGDIFIDGAISGLLCGRGVKRSRGRAGEIERMYDDEFLHAKGSRRKAVVFADDIKINYNKAKAKLNISFVLPKGSYATVFLEALCGKNLL